MSVQKKHRALVEGCLKSMWERGFQQSIQTIEPGSLIILSEQADLGDGPFTSYYLRIVYTHNRNQTKVATITEDDYHEFNGLIDHDTSCVLVMAFY